MGKKNAKTLSKMWGERVVTQFAEGGLWAVTIVGDKFILDFSRKILEITQNIQLTQSVLPSN